MEENLRIADLITAYLQQNITTAEAKELQGWLERSPENRALFDRMMIEQNLESDLAALRSYDAKSALEIIKQYPQQPLKNKGRVIRWPRIAAAASIILALSAGSYLLLHKMAPTQQVAQQKNDIAPGHNQATLTLANGQKIILTKGLSGQLAIQNKTVITATQNTITYQAGQSGDQLIYNTLSTAKGEQSPYPLVLADGTKVWLNAESSITFPTAFNGATRIVKITGEAYFEVEHNDRQPFKVEYNNQTATDIGTHFDINAYADETNTTTLLEGSVKVNNLVLKPGEQTDGKKITTVNTAQVIAWKNGQFRFNGDHIQTIMRALARWYDIDVSYRGPITQEVFYAKLSRQRNISAVLRVLERTKGIHFKIEGRRVTVIE